MKLVVDTSIIFSLFKSNSFTNKLLREFSFELFAPSNLLNELYKYSDLICFKAGITKDKFKEDVSLLPEVIEFKEPSQFFRDKADKLISHKEDISFLALALELKIPIWSNDPHLIKQLLVPVYKTSDLLKMFLRGEF